MVAWAVIWPSHPRRIFFSCARCDFCRIFASRCKPAGFFRGLVCVLLFFSVLRSQVDDFNLCGNIGLAIFEMGGELRVAELLRKQLTAPKLLFHLLFWGFHWGMFAFGW